MPKNNTLVARLQALFDADPALKETCITTSKAEINRNTGNRVFDKFPPLISIDDCTPLIEEYQDLLTNGTKHKVRILQKKLIKIACDELLDKDGNIDQALIDLLDWQPCVSKIDNYQAVSAFVGMMNIFMSNASITLLQDNQPKYLAMTKLINNNYGEWIREHMRENAVKYNAKYDNYSLNNEMHPLLFVSIFAGGVVGLGIYAAAKVTQEVYNEHKPLSLPEAPIL